mmetsp:Transcript_13965/g.33096  ORF Transcript_13965/g.33096 Transcript_13965/m.33096 type:complete len:345 (+) Transcript_13965:896-1930(+)
MLTFSMLPLKRFVLLLCLVCCHVHGEAPGKNPQKGLTLQAAKDRRAPRLQGGRWVDGLKNGAASGLATVCAKSALQPFDAMKTLQMNSVEPLSLGAAASELWARGAFYNGLAITLVGSVPSTYVYFSVYQFIKSHLTSRWGVSRDSSSDFRWRCAVVLCAAGIGNFIASFLRPPYEMVKQRLQTGLDASAFAAIAHVYGEHGLAGFWRGLCAQMARDIPYAMATLLTYEVARAVYRTSSLRGRPTKEQATDLGPLENAFLGAVAGSVGSIVTNPMDVMMTRVNLGKNAAGLDGLIATGREILAGEGPGAFFKGCGPRLAHKAPANAVFFLTYEFFRALLGVKGP